MHDAFSGNSSLYEASNIFIHSTLISAILHQKRKQYISPSLANDNDDDDDDDDNNNITRFTSLLDVNSFFFIAHNLVVYS